MKRTQRNGKIFHAHGLEEQILFKMSIEHKPGEWERNKQAPRREPDVGLYPRTLGSQPKPKADA